MTKLCEKFSFAEHKLSMYNALANDLVEAFNKNVVHLALKGGLKIQAGLE